MKFFKKEDKKLSDGLKALFIVVGAIVTIGAVIAVLYNVFKKYFKISVECGDDDDEDYFDDFDEFDPIDVPDECKGCEGCDTGDDEEDDEEEDEEDDEEDGE